MLYLIIRQSEKPAQLLTRVGWLAAGIRDTIKIKIDTGAKLRIR